jgi:copper chaperone CopZ
MLNAWAHKGDNMKTSLNIEGLSCEHCVKHLKETLKEVAGVKRADVSLKAKNAVVDHADSVTLDTLKAAVVEAGFEVV